MSAKMTDDVVWIWNLQTIRCTTLYNIVQYHFSDQCGHEESIYDINSVLVCILKELFRKTAPPPFFIIYINHIAVIINIMYEHFTVLIHLVDHVKGQCRSTHK